MTSDIDTIVRENIVREMASFVVGALGSLKTNKQLKLETDIHHEIKKLLHEMRIDYEYEYTLDMEKLDNVVSGSRIDFFIPRWGIGLEVKKGKPNTKRVSDQIKRYSLSPETEAVILVSERGLVDHLDGANGKPVYYVSLASNWGLAL